MLIFYMLLTSWCLGLGADESGAVPSTSLFFIRNCITLYAKVYTINITLALIFSKEVLVDTTGVHKAVSSYNSQTSFY